MWTYVKPFHKWTGSFNLDDFSDADVPVDEVLVLPAISNQLFWMLITVC